MKRYQLFLLGILLSVTQVIVGQGHPAHTTKAPIDTIPFELTLHNNIAIKAVINDADTVKLMFHTAATGITLIEAATEKMTSMKWNDGANVESWGGASETRYSDRNTLQIGSFRWDSLSIFENTNSGPTTDGKFGPDLFDGKAIEINFEDCLLLIHRSLPEKVAAYEKVPLSFENGLMFIEGMSSIGGKDYPNRFLIHSGYGGAVLYDDKFVSDSNIGEQIDIIEEQELRDSYGNVLKTKKGSLPKFTIGATTFEAVPVGFFTGSIGRQKMSVMGGNLLKRFNLIIDVDRATIYLKPNKLKALPYIATANH